MELAELTTLRLGGPAGAYVEARTEAEVVEAARGADLILAGGSNVVIADEGVAGTVARIVTRGVERDGTRLRVAAGEDWDALVAMCVAEGLQGFECLSGIPGSVGATPIQNVGAYGQEVAETVESVRVLDRETGRVEDMPAAACGFVYRGSVFKYHDRRVVLSVTFQMRDADDLRRAALRRAGPQARRPGRRQRSAGRGARGGAGAAARQGHGHRPRRPRLGQRRLVLHQPDPRLAARAARRPGPSRTVASRSPPRG